MQSVDVVMLQLTKNFHLNSSDSRLVLHNIV